MTVMSKKGRQIFQGKINRGDTVEVIDVDDLKRLSVISGKNGATP